MPLLEMDQQTYKTIWGHLLPQNSFLESAAFLFVEYCIRPTETVIQLKDYSLIQADEFAEQYSDYLELKDETRAALIQKAHSLDAALVEMHSHPGPWPAVFSITDRQGLEQIVPHMQWRLKGKPYLAIVVAASGFDALLWTERAANPTSLGGLLIDGKVMRPTNLSIRGWKNEQYESSL